MKCPGELGSLWMVGAGLADRKNLDILPGGNNILAESGRKGQIQGCRDGREGRFAQGIKQKQDPEGRKYWQQQRAPTLQQVQKEK